jgi:hypothetical protein
MIIPVKLTSKRVTIFTNQERRDLFGGYTYVSQTNHRVLNFYIGNWTFYVLLWKVK